MDSEHRTRPTSRRETGWWRAGAVIVAATWLAHCNAGSLAPDGRPDAATVASGAAGSDASPFAVPGDAATVVDSPVGSDASEIAAPDGASSDRPSGDDASSSFAGDSSVAAAAPDPWATWPMPNAPSSGLPNPQSYDTSTPGIAVDRVTGLMWQRGAILLSSAKEGDAPSILEQSLAVCAALDLGGYHDWRMPSRIELVSLLDFVDYPASNAAVFPADGDLMNAFYLSSSRHALGTANASVGEVYFNSAPGVLYANIVAFPPVGDASYTPLQGPDAVRCVRGHGAATGPHYTIGDGIVRDNWTGLTWVQAPSVRMEPSAIGSYCNSLVQNGGGWRAPSANELETLWGDSTDPDTVAIDSDAFPGTAQLNQGLGSADTYQGEGADSGPAEWIDVVGAASTNRQEDVYATPPIVGFEPADEYWFYAQCVR